MIKRCTYSSSYPSAGLARGQGWRALVKPTLSSSTLTVDGNGVGLLSLCAVSRAPTSVCHHRLRLQELNTKQRGQYRGWNAVVHRQPLVNNCWVDKSERDWSLFSNTIAMITCRID
jgi:hypothetical protein